MVLALVMVLSMAYFGPVLESYAASASSYISTSYAANLSVKTTKVVNLMDVPSTAGTGKYTLAADTMLTVKKLHKNTSGTYWYEVLYYDMTLYIDATATQLVDHLTGDVTVTDLLSPAALGYGQGFPIAGTITSSLNKLGTVTAAVHYNSNINGAPAITSSATVNGYSYSLKSSTVDNNLIFSDLAAGSYTYLLTVEAISYYIDNSGALATSTQKVVLDNKPLVVTNASSPNPVVAKGIDVSTWQGNINWSAVSSQIDFAILRLGFSTTLDDQFLNNAAGCNKYGVPFGVYHYSYATTEAQAVAEAEFVISVLKNYDVDLPIFFDIEDEDQAALGSTAIQNIVKAFCETIKNAGYEPGLYTFLSWFNSYFSGSYYNSLPKWVAQIQVSSCSYPKGQTIWQYSWTGSFSGISGDVDCNYYYGEFPGKNTDTSYLGSCTYYPSNATAKITSAVNLRQYPSTNHSVVKELAVGTEVHVTGIYKNTYGNYWYQVEADGYAGYIDSGYAEVTELHYDDLSVVDPTMSDLALKTGYYLKGKLRSQYNQMSKVYAKVYSGEDTLATPRLTSSDTPNAKSYTLNYSTVCDNMIFSDLSAGYYTYELSADVKNYYVNNGTLTSETENVVVWTAPFTVGGATITPPASAACAHNTVTDAAVPATCTATGLTAGSHCSKCGVVFTEQTVVPATGHSYCVTSSDATCVEYQIFHYECGSCGDSFDISADAMSEWSDVKPEGVDESLIESQVQYRYSDCTSQSWVSNGDKSVQYVNSWPTGFNTSHSLYTKYNNKSAKVTASETSTTKTVVNSDKLVGYLYYHWCTPDLTSCWAYETDEYTIFHAYYDTTDPSNYACDTSDYSYKTSHSSCSNSNWWLATEVYEQKYTTYNYAYDGKTWGDWSDWSATVYTAVDNTRKVESRTAYRFTGAELGDHSWSDGVCSVCSKVCDHSGYTDTCGICGKSLATPVITPLYPSVNLKDEVVYNVYFTTSDMDNVPVEDMGLATFSTPQENGTVETADDVIPGAVKSGNNFMVHSNGVRAKKLGDLLYFKVYAKLADGRYVYSDMYSYSAKLFAETMLKSTSADAKLKQLCVAMLNYGAAAQTQFSYKPYNLMNSGLTADQQNSISAYSSDMVSALPTVSSSKAGQFGSSGGYSLLYPSVEFDGAFALRYYFTPANAMDGDLTLYCWSLADFNNATVLTKENATYSYVMSANGFSGQYWASYSGIFARKLDETVFVAGVYESNGVTYCTGVIPYSLGRFCVSQVNNSTSESTIALAQSTAVYGYYAKQYFG